MQAFMSAWQAVCKNPVQSRLLIPAGRFLISSMFFTGPCVAPQPITIQVVGTVLGTTDISDYPNEEWLRFEKHNGLKIIGGGTFDGQGQSSWPNAENCESGNDAGCARLPSVSTTTTLGMLASLSQNVTLICRNNINFAFSIHFTS